ncbi:hypothetical protein CPC08DRAFT_173877 [Agrocybe pediades]|nr:hypothetical protein CPC08DRAFT_173877 [Agrocybe pediades]
MIISFITITETVSFDNVPNSTPQLQVRQLPYRRNDRQAPQAYLSAALLSVQSQPCPASPGFLIILAHRKLRFVTKVIRIPNTSHLPQAVRSSVTVSHVQPLRYKELARRSVE